MDAKPFTGSWPAVPEAVADLRGHVIEFAQRAGAPPETISSIKLAVSEAATNAVLHAYVDTPEQGEVRAVVCAEPDRLVVVVRDWGSGMVPRLDTPGLGLGLPTIATLTSAFDVEAADGAGTLLRMKFSRATPAAA